MTKAVFYSPRMKTYCINDVFKKFCFVVEIFACKEVSYFYYYKYIIPKKMFHIIIHPKDTTWMPIQIFRCIPSVSV